jgi:F420-non-reducing hydrogenase large subunit
MKTITIDPITRLEGHGRIRIYLDDDGNVARALFQVPELRGFEAFAVGRHATDMPQITSRICGVCPMAHHMAGTKALDALYGVTPSPGARAVRDLLYSAFMAEDHALHFYFLGGPDFVVGPTAPKAERNILGVVAAVGRETARTVIEMRKRLRDLITEFAGKVTHPVFGLPGGVSKSIPEDARPRIRELGDDAIAFANLTIELFHKLVLGNREHLDLVLADHYRHETYYMGTVDADNKVNFYDGKIRVVTPTGEEHLLFDPADYATHVGEHVEDWTYIKFPFLRDPGWQGFTDGADSGIYRVAPLARLNASSGMATPLAAAEYERMFDALGGKPAHNTLAYHWARLVELLYACEHIRELADSPDLTSTDLRATELTTPTEGIGCVEAPRGTLLHHYQSDERGLLTACNLVVATVGNAGAISMSIEKAARALIRGGKVDDGLLNMVEMAFRAYDPCLACATHALPGQMPLVVELVAADGEVVKEIARSS